ncbi:tyrosine-type recombinase/integrase [Streptosporangium sandarakinum]|uniref:tyrosine-type recombinase/integrase n=1 Tax=Streptosporangium sandarakinum TaxID=1260955 RepID=UPI0015CE0072
MSTTPAAHRTARCGKCSSSRPESGEARLHDARHTAGTLLVERGVHIRVVQEILGHARVTMTERYTHIAGSQVKDASERMGTALWVSPGSDCHQNCNHGACEDRKSPPR